jgi:ribosomal protein L24E
MKTRTWISISNDEISPGTGYLALRGTGRALSFRRLLLASRKARRSTLNFQAQGEFPTQKKDKQLGFAGAHRERRNRRY